MVGNEYTERDATLSPTLVPAQLENADLLDAFPQPPPLPIRLGFKSRPSNIPNYAKDTSKPTALANCIIWSALKLAV